MLVWNAGIITTEDALSGFNNAGVLAVGSLFVVIKGVERSRLADKVAKHVFGLRTSFSMGLLRLMGVSFLLSAFLNNTPVVALLIPITRDWALTRGFSPSLLLMPLSYSCIFGGLATIMGTSTNLVVQGLVIEAGKEDPSIEELGFFEPGLIGVPLGILGMLYIVMVAPRVLPRTNAGAVQSVTGNAEEFFTEVMITWSKIVRKLPFRIPNPYAFSHHLGKPLSSSLCFVLTPFPDPHLTKMEYPQLSSGKYKLECWKFPAF